MDCSSAKVTLISTMDEQLETRPTPDCTAVLFHIQFIYLVRKFAKETIIWIVMSPARPLMRPF